MKYILNKTPLRTTNNYKINDIEVDLDLNNDITTNELKINSSDVKVNQVIKNNFTSKIGLDYDKYNSLSITVDENTIIDNPIIISKDILGDINVDEINIDVKSNSKVNFIIKYTSSIKCFNNVKQILNVADNSIVNISFINLVSDESKNFVAIEDYINEDSNVTYNFIDLNGNLRLSNYYCKLNGRNAINNFNNIYIGLNEERIDLNYYIENINEKTISNMNVQGILNDNSYKTFKGTINFIKGAKKSVGKELENCILLSDTCISRSLPMLLCSEEDVEGAHGVSTGKIDKDKQFYLMSRGLSEKEAIKLIVNANFNNIINQINDINIQKEILDIINKKLD